MLAAAIAAGCDSGGSAPDAGSDNYLTINGVRYDYVPSTVVCRSVSPRYWIQLLKENMLHDQFSTQIMIYDGDGAPPAAGSLTIVPPMVSQVGQVSISIGVPDISGTIQVQSGTLTVTYVANRPVFEFANAPGINDVDGLTSPTSGHFACP